MKGLLEPLARLMLKTAEHCQIIVVSHAQPLVDTFARQTGTTLVSLEKYLGETIVGKTHLPSWK